MKKLVVMFVFAILGTSLLNAQEQDPGGVYIGANVGIPLSAAADLTSVNFGFDGAFLFPVVRNLEIGPLVGYTQYVGDGTYVDEIDDNVIVRDYKNVSFMPLAVSARYYFNKGKLFAGADLGFAVNLSGDAKNGAYGKAKFGFDLGRINLIASFSGITGGSDYEETSDSNIISVSGFHTGSFGIEFKL